MNSGEDRQRLPKCAVVPSDASGQKVSPDTGQAYRSYFYRTYAVAENCSESLRANKALF